MRRRPPGSTRTDTLCPDTTLFRSCQVLLKLLGSMRSPGTTVGADGTARLARKPRIARPTATSPSSEEHTSELQSLMRISYAVFCLKKINHQERLKAQTASKTKVEQSNRDFDLVNVVR